MGMLGSGGMEAGVGYAPMPGGEAHGSGSGGAMATEFAPPGEGLAEPMKSPAPGALEPAPMPPVRPAGWTGAASPGSAGGRAGGGGGGGYGQGAIVIPLPPRVPSHDSERKEERRESADNGGGSALFLKRNPSLARKPSMTRCLTTQGQIDGFCSQLPFKCYLLEVAFVGD